MDTKANGPGDLDSPIPSSCSITLNSLQSTFYLSGMIDIYSSDGYKLEAIGYAVKPSSIESSIYRLREQIYILECILTKLNNRLELPAAAVSVLGDLIYRMQGFCREYLK